MTAQGRSFDDARPLFHLKCTVVSNHRLRVMAMISPHALTNFIKKLIKSEFRASLSPSATEGIDWPEINPSIIYQVIEHIVAAIVEVKLKTADNNYSLLKNEGDEVKTEVAYLPLTQKWQLLLHRDWWHVIKSNCCDTSQRMANWT